MMAELRKQGKMESVLAATVHIVTAHNTGVLRQLHEAPSGATASTLMKAKFGDDLVDIPGFTLAEHQQHAQVQEQTANAKGKGDLWVGTHSVSGNPLAIKTKPDRSPIVYLTDSKKQILQVKLKTWSR